MGIRGQKNIRVVRNSVSSLPELNSAVKKPNKLFNLFLNEEKVIKANLTMIKRDMVDTTKMLTPEEAKKANELINLIINEYFANHAYYWNLTNIDVFTMLDHVYTVCAVNDHQGGLSRRTWPLRGNPALIDIMTATGMLEKKDKVFYKTERGNDLLKLCRKLSLTYPFEWSNYRLPPSEKLNNAVFSSSASRALNINGKVYYLESNTYTGSQAMNLNEMIFYANNEGDTEDSINQPLKDAYSLKELRRKEPQSAEIIQQLFDSLNKTNIEMIPLNSKSFLVTLQGTINNEPVFAKLNPNILKSIYNAYGGDVKMTLDYSSVDSSTKGLLHVFKNGSLVFSRVVDTQYPISITSKINENTQQILLNTSSYNTQQLLQFGEK